MGRIILAASFLAVLLPGRHQRLRVRAEPRHSRRSWPVRMKSINRPALGMNEIVAFNVFGFIQGLVAIWTYAAIRPRFGEGPKTAVFAALLTWVTAYVFVDAMPTIMGIFELPMTLMLVGVGLVEIVVATLVGAYLYKE